ncbi:MAG: hypothetical protein KGR18_10155 [Acidobacteria bacterium]|nr:hypothetical protein [Acidobacteriota bacterium]
MNTRITRTPLSDPDSPTVEVTAPDGTPIGTITFEGKEGTRTSRLTYAAGQQPHRSWPLKRKHRQR